jgi:fibulin 1/2
VDECDSNPCGGTVGHCYNTPGSFYCSCPPGYKLSSGQCQDIDECRANTHGCTDTCLNTVGSYTCKCKVGYQLAVDGNVQ